MKNIVMARFLSDVEAKWHAFMLPHGYKAHKNEFLIVERKRGETIVQCVTDSSEVDDIQEIMIMNGNEITDKIKKFISVHDFDWGE